MIDFDAAADQLAVDFLHSSMPPLLAAKEVGER
jgi:hypothetical protein